MKFNDDNSLKKTTRTSDMVSRFMRPHQFNHEWENFHKIETYNPEPGVYHHVYYKDEPGGNYTSVLHSLSNNEDPAIEGYITSASGLHDPSVPDNFLGGFHNLPEHWKSGAHPIVQGEVASVGPRGSGTLLYREMAKVHGRMASDSSTSEPADRVWEKILGLSGFSGQIGLGKGNRHWVEYSGPKPKPINTIISDGRTLMQMKANLNHGYTHEFVHYNLKSPNDYVEIRTKKNGQHFHTSAYHLDHKNKRIHSTSSYHLMRGLPGLNNRSFGDAGQASATGLKSLENHLGYRYAGDAPDKILANFIKKSESEFRSAGFRLPNGDIIETGHHHDIEQVPAEYQDSFEEGFITKDGVFLNRQQAAELVHKVDRDWLDSYDNEAFELEKNEDGLLAMLEHDSPTERILALKSAKVQLHHILTALNDEDSTVRAYAAQHDSINGPALLECLRQCKDPETAKILLGHDSCEDEHLQYAIEAHPEWFAADGGEIEENNYDYEDEDPWVEAKYRRSDELFEDEDPWVEAKYQKSEDDEYYGTKKDGINNDIRSSDIKLHQLFRSYKNSPHHPRSLLLKYLVNRVENPNVYDKGNDSPEAIDWDRKWMAHHQFGGAKTKNGHVLASHLHAAIKNNPHLIDQLKNHQKQLHDWLREHSAENIEKVNGEECVALARGVKNSYRYGADHDICSYTDEIETAEGFGDKIKSWYVPLKNIWYSYDLGPSSASSADYYGSEDEWLVSNHSRNVADPKSVKRLAPRNSHFWDSDWFAKKKSPNDQSYDEALWYGVDNTINEIFQKQNQEYNPNDIQKINDELYGLSSNSITGLSRLKQKLSKEKIEDVYKSLEKIYSQPVGGISFDNFNSAYNVGNFLTDCKNCPQKIINEHQNRLVNEVASGSNNRFYLPNHVKSTISLFANNPDRFLDLIRPIKNSHTLGLLKYISKETKLFTPNFLLKLSKQVPEILKNSWEFDQNNFINSFKQLDQSDKNLLIDESLNFSSDLDFQLPPVEDDRCFISPFLVAETLKKLLADCSTKDTQENFEKLNDFLKKTFSRKSEFFHITYLGQKAVTDPAAIQSPDVIDSLSEFFDKIGPNFELDAENQPYFNELKKEVAERKSQIEKIKQSSAFVSDFEKYHSKRLGWL